MSEKIRLDAALVERGLAPSRDKARALIMAGEVLCRGQIADKPDKRVTSQDTIVIKKRYPYVSRGALKIQTACTEFGIEPRGLKVVDIVRGNRRLVKDRAFDGFDALVLPE